MRYRKKPVVIEAFQLGDRENVRMVPDWALFDPTCSLHMDGATIRTLEGDMFASPGDWIIRGVKGELYPCKPDIFAATYDAVDDGPRDAYGNPVTIEQMDAAMNYRPPSKLGPNDGNG